MIRPIRVRKRPVIVETMQYTGKNGRDIRRWMVGSARSYRAAEPFRIATLEGEMTVSPGDWVIKGIQGEFYPCKPDIFQATYDQAGDGEVSQ